MSEVFRKIYHLLTKPEQKQLYGISSAVILMGLFEVVGISSILPFLSVVSNPEIIHRNPYLRWGYGTFGFDNTNSFLMALGGVTILVLAISQTFNAFTHYLIQDFTGMRNWSLSVRLLRKYLHQPYVFFLNVNSAELSTLVLSEVQQVIKGVLVPGLDIIANVFVAVCIAGLLCLIDPLLVLLVSLILGGTYVIVFLMVKRKLDALGRARFDANRLRFKITSEVFGGIKDVKLLGLENLFIKQFSEPARRLAKCFIYTSLIESIPNYAISLIAFSGILFITMYLIAVKENFQQALPVIGLYAMAGYRLLPIIRSIYGKVTEIRFAIPAVDVLYHDLKNQAVEERENEPEERIVPLPFTRTVELKDLSFTYPHSEKPVLTRVNLTIRANTSIGIVGATGCGKTTLIDVILGLLIPQAGTLSIDGTGITETNRRNWQVDVGYVPQQIFLSDDTITHNIAFGILDENIDFEAVERAARIAHLHDFIVRELPQGYDTFVGERGVRLSGGQRQRIGIARALYRDPAFLIFDEATSALDTITETAVMEALSTLSGQKTMIIIAHRLSTVQACDMIYLMEQGRIIAQGDYESLFHTSSEFQKMASIQPEKL